LNESIHGMNASTPTSYQIFISTGEVSGDLQGSLLITSLLRQATKRGYSIQISALGGDRMAAAGATLVGHTSGIGSMGLTEALPFILPTWQVQRRARQVITNHPPDLVILIDYANPNLKLGSYLRRTFPHIPIIYYIAPQVWVWDPIASVKQIIAISDQILSIFPEEFNYIKAHGGNVKWIGHPLVDTLRNAPNRKQARAQLDIEPDEVAVALFPASRHQELRSLLPVMLAAAKQIQMQIPQVRFWIPLSLPTFRRPIEQALLHAGISAQLIEGHTQTLIAAADLAITKSGTVNLEIALLNVPQVVFYKVSSLTFWVVRRLLNFSIPFMSPVNLVEMRSIVPEFSQEQATSDAIAAKAISLLTQPTERQQILEGYTSLRIALGEPGVCDRAANTILDFLPKL
jgi:lipid-A-disaccharide synthase